MIYRYKANLVKVVDGDTIDVIIDLGFDVSLEKRVRLYGIDTPESRTKDQIEKQASFFVKEYVVASLKGKDIYLETIKPSDKYGRYLAKVYINNNSLDGPVCLNEKLIELEYARNYLGGKREDWTSEELQKIINSD